MKNNTIFNFILIILLFFLHIACENKITAMDNPTASYNREIVNNEKSDQTSTHGLYWFGYENNKQKFIPGIKNKFYDPQKPTVIFAHGHKPIHVELDDYKHFQCAKEVCPTDEIVYTHHEWLEAGYNVGVLDWLMYATEMEVKNAEAKLWSINGPKGMRYRLFSGKYVYQNTLKTSIIKEMTDLYIKALKDHSYQEIRFVGFSLGSQLATGLAYEVHKNILKKLVSPHLMPNRISLLDPGWTKGGKDYLGDLNKDGSLDWTGERCRWAIGEMNDYWNEINDFVVDMYNTSVIDRGILGDENEQLHQHVAGPVRILVDYIKFFLVNRKHTSIRSYYFLSFSKPPLLEVDKNGIETGNAVPSASADNIQLNMNKDSGERWTQYQGRKSTSITDDTFSRR